MKASRTIAVLGGGKDSIGIIRRMKQMNLKTIVFDSDKNAPARTSGLSDTFIPVSCYDKVQVLESLINDIRPYPDAVLCAGTDCPDVIAVVAETFRLPGVSYSTASISMDKEKQRKLFFEAGIRVPKWFTSATPRIAERRVLVVKPVSNRGSRGIMRVLPGKPLGAAIQYAKKFDKSKRVIIEEWIDGIQLSSESLIQNGEILYTAFSERNYGWLGELHPYVIEDGGDMPPNIPVAHEKDYKEIAGETLQKCVDAIGLVSGTLKGDLVWDGHDIWVIEVATRLSGGSFCSDQIPAVWGVDFVGYAIKLALGEYIYPGEIRPYFRRYMAQRFVIPPRITSHPERGPGFICYGVTRNDARYKANQEVQKWLGREKKKQ